MFGTDGKVKLLTLGACCFGLFMVMLDNTVVNVALPSIQRELGAGVSGLQLVLDAYILVFATLLLTAGSLGDRFGRRRVFRAGLVVFVASSALCGLAPTLAALVGGRALQAVGGAALLPSSLAILTAAFPDPRERVQAIGLWSGVSAMALAAGPVVGGLLTDGLGWRWVFYVNLPVGVTAFLVAGRVMAESRNPDARRLDLPGLLLGSLGLGGVTLGLIEGNQRGWGSAVIVSLLAAGAACLAAFVVVESRRRWPMLSLRFFRDAVFSTANLVVLLAGFALLGFVFFNTLYFQAVQGWSPLQAGLRTLPNTLAVVVTAPLAGRLASRFGYRVPVVAGLLLAAAALWLLTGIQVGTSYAALWWKLALLGAGLGLSISPATAAGVAAMPGTQAGVASAVITTSRQVGGALGVAVLGAVAAARSSAVLPVRLAAAGVPGPVREQVETAAGQGLGASSGPAAAGAAREAVAAAFVTGVHTSYLVAGVALAAGAVAALLFLRPRRARPGSGDASVPAEIAPGSLGG
ncbi:MAG TPA: MFS transporter [Actinomycetes bacterium]|nr:MFS transporter [Actinomycetes bacterium]